MAGKTLGEIVASQQAAEGNVGEEYMNRQGKSLPGYNPVNPYEASTVGAKYLQEVPEEEFQMQDDADDFELPEEEEEEEAAPADELDALPEEQLTDEQREARQRRWIEIQRQQSVELEERHKELMAKLDKALAEEEQRAKDLYAIENRKKNTLDYARRVYGDSADVEKIMDSADSARTVASKEVHGLTGMISAQMDAALHKNNMVTVLMPNGQVRMMDKDVAEALSLYTGKTREGMIEAAAAGVTDLDNKLDEFQLTRNEEEKLAELQRRIAENDRQAARFEQKAPETMSQEEYNAWNRDRRFKEFGYPDAGISCDYVMTREGVYEWNGRPLPSAMSSPSMMRELEQEKQEPAMSR